MTLASDRGGSVGSVDRALGSVRDMGAAMNWLPMLRPYLGGTVDNRNKPLVLKAPAERTTNEQVLV